MNQPVKLWIMALLATIWIMGCASSARDRYEALNRITDCKESPREVDFGNSPKVDSNPVEGSLDDSKCIVVSDQRTSYSTFQFVATAPTQEFEVQVFPKLRGFGFQGQHTLFLPSLFVIDGVTVKPAKGESYVSEKNAWTGNRHYFGFSIVDLVPGKSYYLLVTSNNSKPGSMLNPDKAAIPYYGTWSSDGPDIFTDSLIVLDASLFVGPFGDFKIKMGKYRRSTSK